MSVAEEPGEPPDGIDDEVVHREPHGTAPVRVAAEQSARRLTRLVVDGVLHVTQPQGERMISMCGTERSDAVWRQELGLAEQVVEDAIELIG